MLIGRLVFGYSLIPLYAMSTLYDGVSHPTLQRLFGYGDHTVIFPPIPGIYTPITFGHCGRASASES
jgi:channel protein (hemolysin III family)